MKSALIVIMALLSDTSAVSLNRHISATEPEYYASIAQEINMYSPHHHQKKDNYDYDPNTVS